MPDRWLRLGDIRQLFSGRSRGAIYRDIANGHLPPPVKMGGINYWSEARLNSWLADREVPAEPQLRHSKRRFG